MLIYRNWPIDTSQPSVVAGVNCSECSHLYNSLSLLYILIIRVTYTFFIYHAQSNIFFTFLEEATDRLSLE